jgi:hypothetical protein
VIPLLPGFDHRRDCITRRRAPKVTVTREGTSLQVFESLETQTRLLYIFSMQFIFDIRKAVAATGFLCELNGGRVDMLKVIKMLYIADRKALLSWHRPITGDAFWSLENGPIVSRIYDLIRGRICGPEMEIWRSFFNPGEDDTVSLREDARVDTKPLSRREKEALEEAYHRIQPLSIGQVIDYVHRFPEWKDPGKSSVPIDPRTIFYHENIGENAVKEIEEDLEVFQAAKLAFQSA